MPFKIQRSPRGLNNLLSIFGGSTPVELEDRVRAMLEITQMYGLQQRIVAFNNNPALAALGTVQVENNLPAGTANQWAILFGLTGTFVKTNTMTALRGSIFMQRSGGANAVHLASRELGPFGATEAGPCSVVFWAPQPIILVPPWSLFARPDIIGTDAAVNTTAIAEIGILQ